MLCFAYHFCLQATVARDVALSRNDELTLALSAARREAATVRTQVTMQQQELLQLRVQAAVAGKAHRPGTAAGASRPGSSWAMGTVQQQQQQWPGPGGGFVSPTGYHHQQQQQRARSVSPTAGLRSPTATIGGAGGAVYMHHGSSPSRLAAAAASSSPQHQQQQPQPHRRLAELEAAEATLAAQAEALKRRAAQHREDAARQLQDLSVAAAATGTAAATAVAAAAAAAAAGGARVGHSSLAGYEMWSPALPGHQLHRQYLGVQPQQQQQQHVEAAPGTPGFNQSFVAGKRLAS